MSLFKPSPLLESLRSAGLVPGPASVLLPEDFEPTVDLDISFGKERRVLMGNLFRAGECKTEPMIRLSANEVNKTYTLILTDPDAPTPVDPRFAFWRHWIVSGLQPAQADDKVMGGPADGRVLTKYLGPGPKDDSGPHRYLFLVYEEPQQGLSVAESDLGGDELVQRRSFKPAEFAKRHKLKLVAVNWMTCVGDGWEAVLAE